MAKVEADDCAMIGEVIDNRYKVVKKLGEGGMGEVYAAEHVHIQKRVAIKLLRTEVTSNPEAVQRFQQEARSASSIGHQNIIAIEDAGRLPDGRFYLCMELLDGEPLNDMLKAETNEGRILSPDRSLDILIKSCHGLAAAHAKGIVHRDMKPENIFVTSDERGDDIPKLLDFGIAKVSGTDGDNNLTRTGTIFGTPFYMAPEQALGQGIDHRADIYAVGVIMYELFTGSVPFQGESFMGILTKHITAEPEPPAQRAAKFGQQLPDGVESIIARAMKKEADHRFQSMDELVSALVSLHRRLVGPGMSGYMAAHVPPSGMMQAFNFSNDPSSSSPAGPPSRPHSAGHSGPVAMPGSGAYSAQHGGHPGTPSGPMAAVPSGGMPAHTPIPGPHDSAGYSGGYHHAAASSSFVAPRKSKAGLIAAVLAILAVVGGTVGYILISSEKESPPVVVDDNTGENTGENPDGPGVGVVTVKEPGNDAGAGKVPGNDVKDPPVDPDNTTVLTPEVLEPVVVQIRSRPKKAVVKRDDGVVLGATPLKVEVKPGEEARYVLSKGKYKDLEITLDGKDKVFVAKMEKKPRSSGGGKDPKDPGGKDPGGKDPKDPKDPKEEGTGTLGIGLE